MVWAFFVTMFVYRDYKWRDLPKLVHRTVKTVTIVMILIGFAACFGYLMTLMQIPLKVTTFFTSISDNKYVILMLINIMLLMLGTLMDMSPLILILTPILLPVVKAMGVDPVHFGMIMMVNLGMGLITPPVGTVLFVGAAVAKLKIGRRRQGDEAVLHRAVHRADDGHLHAVAESVVAAGAGLVDGPTRSALRRTRARGRHQRTGEAGSAGLLMATCVPSRVHRC